MVDFGPLTSEIRWRVWGTPANFNGFCVLASLLHRRFISVIAAFVLKRFVKLQPTNQPAPTSLWLNRSQPKFARCLAISCTGILYMHFWGLLPFNRILPAAKFTLHPSLAFSYIRSVTTRHSSSGRQPNFVAWYYGTFAEAPPIFGWAAITLGIGRHSSYGRPM